MPLADADPAVTRSDGVVTLRPWAHDDAAFLAAASADPEIRRYNGEHDRLGHPRPPLTVADAEAVIERFEEGWRAFAQTGTAAAVAFAIVEAETGELAGCCGVDEWSKTDVVQFGYWIAPATRRRGLASRAAVLFIRWLFERGAARVFVTIVDGNDASVAVARRAGLVHEGTMRGHGVWEGRASTCSGSPRSPTRGPRTLGGSAPWDGRGPTTGKRARRASGARPANGSVGTSTTGASGCSRVSSPTST